LKLLALDTSTEYCSAALSIDGDLDVREVKAGQRHSELLIGMIDDLLTSHALSVRDLDGIAYGEGPGSFTGLRIACGVVQGLAFGAGVRVLGVGTLLAMAEGSGAARVVCCVDARMHEIYHAAYVRGDGEGRPWRTLHAPAVCVPAVAPPLAGNGWFACGSGFAVYRDVLEERYAGQLAEIAPELYPHARDILALAAPRFESGEGLTAERAVPVYLRDKVALRIDERATR
jgi:tRNA threonylcarbamoyladenosine biosynthesis protein TsaB